mmetsp:Transcript_12739/g.39351  ORF Transcript_12739/g.39351 Transcript_12739/m.39351 type:complete len:451 (-) Transcript_12739:274-1626(-)
MARLQPATTAMMRSTKTVIRNVTARIATSGRGSALTFLRSGQSTTSKPDLIRMAARQERGTNLASEPSPRTAAKSTTECAAPEIGVRPPVRTFTTVRIVAPAPAWPPKMPATVLPMPWPTSSRSLSWKEDVMESATREVSSESTAPRTASVSAVGTRAARSAGLAAGSVSAGSPWGMAPSDGTERPKTAEAVLAATSASRGRGMLHVNLAGNLYSMKRVKMPMASAQRLGLARANGRTFSALMTWPPPECPSITGICSEQMMPPIPVMKPDRTVLGTSRMAPPNFSTPMAICIRPAMATTVKTTEGSGYLATTSAMTTAIGPVGPVTCAGVPPKSAAKKPEKIAPYRPAKAPAPLVTPKAMARGRATTAVVTPAPSSVAQLVHWRNAMGAKSLPSGPFRAAGDSSMVAVAALRRRDRLPLARAPAAAVQSAANARSGHLRGAASRSDEPW